MIRLNADLVGKFKSIKVCHISFALSCTLFPAFMHCLHPKMYIAMNVCVNHISVVLCHKNSNCQRSQRCSKYRIGNTAVFILGLNLSFYILQTLKNSSCFSPWTMVLKAIKYHVTRTICSVMCCKLAQS